MCKQYQSRLLACGVGLLFLPGCSLLTSDGPVVPSSIVVTPSVSNVDWLAVSARNTDLTCPSIQVLPKYPALLPNNRPEFDKATEFYATRGRRTLEGAVLRSEPYFQQLESIFEDHSLPLELLNIAVIESNFRSDAKSSRGAVGAWQFMRGTAKLYGLTVSKRVDERKDVIKSTRAAAMHLRDLYHTFDDWYLAIAAYNAGVGGVQRAIEKTGSRDFFELSRRSALRKETINFVQNFFAVSKVVGEIRQTIPSSSTFASVGAPRLPVRFR